MGYLIRTEGSSTSNETHMWHNLLLPNHKCKPEQSIARKVAPPITPQHVNHMSESSDDEPMTDAGTYSFDLTPKWNNLLLAKSKCLPRRSAAQKLAPPITPQSAEQKLKVEHITPPDAIPPSKFARVGTRVGTRDRRAVRQNLMDESSDSDPPALAESSSEADTDTDTDTAPRASPQASSQAVSRSRIGTRDRRAVRRNLMDESSDSDPPSKCLPKRSAEKKPAPKVAAPMDEYSDSAQVGTRSGRPVRRNGRVISYTSRAVARRRKTEAGEAPKPNGRPRNEIDTPHEKTNRAAYHNKKACNRVEKLYAANDPRVGVAQVLTLKTMPGKRRFPELAQLHADARSGAQAKKNISLIVNNSSKKNRAGLVLAGGHLMSVKEFACMTGRPPQVIRNTRSRFRRGSKKKWSLRKSPLLWTKESRSEFRRKK
jgi:hypothetical protein